MNYLNEFSNRLISKTKDLENSVQSLVFETQAMDVKVHNTFNQFLMLSNVQFIENVKFFNISQIYVISIIPFSACL